MKSLWISNQFKYDGSQLKPLYSYIHHKILGDSIVSWRGACDIPFSNMIDGEDFIDQSQIKGDDMIHFIIEIFDRDLVSGVLVQRLLASIVKDLIQDSVKVQLRRGGDDLYYEEGKLSISIASKSAVSTMVHFAVNITNDGTPVKTTSLADLKIEPQLFAQKVMEAFEQEWIDIVNASRKVFPLESGSH